jgi:hypothetical protein
LTLTCERITLEEDARNLALTWWDRHFPGTVPDPFRLPEMLGFQVCELEELNSKGIDGMCRRSGDGSVDIFLNPLKGKRREGLTAVHECSHPVLHSGQGDFYCRLRSPGSEKDAREWQATRCASHFLMPEPLLMKTVRCIRAVQAQFYPPEFDEDDQYGPNGLAKWGLTVLFNTFPASWTAIKWHLDILNIQSSSLTQRFMNSNVWFPWECAANIPPNLSSTIRRLNTTPATMNALFEQFMKEAV